MAQSVLSKSCKIWDGVVKVEVEDVVILAPRHTQHYGVYVYIVDKIQVAGEHVDDDCSMHLLNLKSLSVAG